MSQHDPAPTAAPTEDYDTSKLVQPRYSRAFLYCVADYAFEAALEWLRENDAPKAIEQIMIAVQEIHHFCAEIKFHNGLVPQFDNDFKISDLLSEAVRAFDDLDGEWRAKNGDIWRKWQPREESHSSEQAETQEENV